MYIYDYIYADLERVQSFYSQLTGGVIELKESNSIQSESLDNKRHYDLKVFKHDAGGSKQESSSHKEVVKPHHAIFQELEDELLNGGYLFDLDNHHEPSLENSETRSIFENALCVKCSGKAVIEDYKRLLFTSNNFKDLVGFINKSIEGGVKGSVPYQIIQKQIDELSDPSVGNRKANRAKVSELKQHLQEMIKSRSLESTEQWVIDAMNTWVNVFLDDIVNIRLYPSENRPKEHLFGNLDRRWFSVQKSSHFHFTYGSTPTQNMTVLGVITAIPEDVPNNDDGTLANKFNPLIEFDTSDMSNNQSIERAFRGVFRGFDGFEEMIRTCRFPRIMIHPILVYRKSAPNESLKPKALAKP